MRNTMFILLTLALAGCFSASRPEAAQWTVEISGDRSEPRWQAPKFGVCRLLQVSVRAPYDSKSVAVMRPDGSLAFDPYNRFSAAPSALLKGAALDALQSSGAFKAIVDSASSVRCDTSLELTATRIALDCREDGRCDALVELSLSLIERREFVRTVKSSGRAPAADGNYTKAFSKAFDSALEDLTVRLSK